MAIEPAITVHHVELPEEASEVIRERVDKLDLFFGRTLGCRVSIEGPGGHHRQGRYRVSIQLKVPQTELVITHQAEDDLMSAIREAFNAADRRLEDYVRKLRGDVKIDQALPRGRVTRLFPERDFGFLTAEGREIFFHRNSVLPPGYDRLEVGSEVRFAEELGEKGPQASTVVIVGSSH